MAIKVIAQRRVLKIGKNTGASCYSGSARCKGVRVRNSADVLSFRI